MTAQPTNRRRSFPRRVAVIACLLLSILVVPWLAGIGGAGQVGAISAAQNPYVERALLPKPATNTFSVSGALSSDGSTAVVGYDKAVSIYGVVGNTYRQIGPTLTEPSGPAAGDTFGESVAVSSDGSTVAVGNSFNGSPTRAAVYVYTRSGNSYVEMGGAPVAVADASYGALGYKVALSGDGATLLIWAMPSPSFNQPTALVYTQVGGVYTRQQAIPTPCGCGTAKVNHALSTDGTTLVVGNPLTSQAVVYVRSGGVYSPFGSPLTASDPPPSGSGCCFGTQVAASGDGATLAITASHSTLNPQQWVVYVFTKGVSGYSQLQEFDAGSTNRSVVPTTVALNGDGTALAVSISAGVSLPEAATALTPTVNIYRKSGVAYTQFGNGLVTFPEASASTRPYGRQLAFSGDGGTLLVGSLSEDPAAIFDTAPIAGVGVWRSNSWNMDNALTTTPNADLSFAYTSGNPETPVLCDWAGTNAKQPGLYSAGIWYIGGGQSFRIAFGTTGDIPVCGDWTGSGKQTIGVFRSGVFYLKNSNASGNTVDIVVGFGQAGDIPVVGDWTGQGKQTVGVYRSGVFYLLNNNVSSATADIVVGFGQAGDVPVIGDWTGGGIESVGVFRNGSWYLRNTNTPGAADIFFLFGTTGDTPLVRSERANGVAGPGIQPRVAPTATAVKGTATVTRNAATATPGKGTATPNPLPPSRP